MRQPLDCWSTAHLFGSYFLVDLIAYICSFDVWIFHPHPIMDVACFAFALGIIYEAVDETFGKGFIMFGRHWQIKFFDERGFSWEDIGFDLAGCLLAVVII